MGTGCSAAPAAHPRDAAAPSLPTGNTRHPKWPSVPEGLMAIKVSWVGGCALSDDVWFCVKSSRVVKACWWHPSVVCAVSAAAEIRPPASWPLLCQPLNRGSPPALLTTSQEGPEQCHSTPAAAAWPRALVPEGQVTLEQLQH